MMRVATAYLNASGWNGRIERWLHEIGKLAVRAGSEIRSGYADGSYLAMAVLFLLSIGLLTYLIASRRRKTELPETLNFVRNALLAVGIGVGLRAADIEVLRKALKVYTGIVGLLLIIGVLLLAKELIVYRKTKHRAIRSFLQYGYFIGLSAMVAFIAQGLAIADVANAALCAILLWFFAFARQADKPNPDADELSDLEIGSKTKMFPTRLREFERIKRYLTGQSFDEPFAVALSAPWGEGKTSFVNVMRRDLAEDGHPVVFVQPMIMDTRDKLMDFFTRQLETLLKRSGIYTGTGSAYQQYFDQVMRFFTNGKASFGELFQWLQPPSGDIRDNKSRLEEDIAVLLGDRKKLFIIVDDLDRVEESSLRDVLVFIKEIVNFKGCAVVFLMDPRNVLDKVTDEYLCKFIQKRFYLDKIEAGEISGYFLEQIDCLKHDYKTEGVIREYGLLKANFARLSEEALSRIARAKNEAAAAESGTSLEALRLEEQQVLLKERMGNPRKAKKLFREIKEMLVYADGMLHNMNSGAYEKNVKRLEPHGMIVRAAMLKVYFEESFAAVCALGDIRLLNALPELAALRALLHDIAPASMVSPEENELRVGMAADFYNLLLFSKDSAVAFAEEQVTSTVKRLAQLDGIGEGRLASISGEDVESFLAALKRSKLDDRYDARIRIVGDVMFGKLDGGDWSLSELLSLFDFKRIRANELMRVPELFGNLLERLETRRLTFEDAETKRACIDNLRLFDSHLTAYQAGSFLNLIRMFLLKDKNYNVETLREGVNGALGGIEEITSWLTRMTLPEGSSDERGLPVTARFRRLLARIREGIEEDAILSAPLRSTFDNLGKYAYLIETCGKIAERMEQSTIANRYVEELLVFSERDIERAISELEASMKDQPFDDFMLYSLSSLIVETESFARKNPIGRGNIDAIVVLYDRARAARDTANHEDVMNGLAIRLCELRANAEAA